MLTTLTHLLKMICGNVWVTVSSISIRQVYGLFYFYIFCFRELVTFSLLSQLYCFGASSVLLPRGTALLVVVVSTVVVVGVRSSFSDDFLLDFFEKQHPILSFQRRPDETRFQRNNSSEYTRKCETGLHALKSTRFFFFFAPSSSSSLLHSGGTL